MALNLDAVGKPIGPFTKDYAWKDTVLCALGVGAGFSDLQYCYEKALKVIPSFGITTMYDFMPQLAATSNVNLAGVLHGKQELIFHHPIPPAGTLTTHGTLTNYYDKGKKKGALVVAKFETVHSNGKKFLPASSPFFRAWIVGLKDLYIPDCRFRPSSGKPPKEKPFGKSSMRTQERS